MSSLIKFQQWVSDIALIKIMATASEWLSAMQVTEQAEMEVIALCVK